MPASSACRGDSDPSCRASQCCQTSPVYGDLYALTLSGAFPRGHLCCRPPYQIDSPAASQTGACQWASWWDCSQLVSGPRSLQRHSEQRGGDCVDRAGEIKKIKKIGECTEWIFCLFVILLFSSHSQVTSWTLVWLKSSNFNSEDRRPLVEFTTTIVNLKSTTNKESYLKSWFCLHSFFFYPFAVAFFAV